MVLVRRLSGVFDERPAGALDSGSEPLRGTCVLDWIMTAEKLPQGVNSVEVAVNKHPTRGAALQAYLNPPFGLAQ